MAGGGAVGRAHIARALVERRARCRSIGDGLHATSSGSGKPFYVPKPGVTPAGDHRAHPRGRRRRRCSRTPASRASTTCSARSCERGPAGHRGLALGAHAGGREALRRDRARARAARDRRQRLPRARRSGGGKRLGCVDVPGQRARRAATRRARPGLRLGRRRGARRVLHSSPMKTFDVRTFGCQMNKHDSERIAGLLEAQRLRRAPPTRTTADVVVFNTCCVRETRRRAPARAGRVAQGLKRAARRSSSRSAAASASATASGCCEQLPHVDVVFGTHNVARLPALLAAAAETRATAGRDCSTTPTDFTSDLPARARAPVARLGADHRRLRQLLHVLHRAVRPRPRALAAARGRRRRGRAARRRRRRRGHAARPEREQLRARPATASRASPRCCARSPPPASSASASRRATRRTSRTRRSRSMADDAAGLPLPAPARAVRLGPHPRGDEPPLHAGELPRARRAALRRDARPRAVDRRHRRLPRRDRGGLRGDDARGRARRATTRRSRSSTRRARARPPRRMDGQVPREVAQERFDRLVAAIQASALAKNLRVRRARTQRVLVEGASKRDDARARSGARRATRSCTRRVPDGHVGRRVRRARSSTSTIDEAQTWFLAG